MPLIEVQDLRVKLRTSRVMVEAIRGVSFSLERGETLGLIGESGCGKSVTAMALMGLLPDSAIISGSIRLDGRELVGLSEPEYCKLRGNGISMIFQEPMTALNPMHTIGRQVAEPLRRHKGHSAAEARKEAIALLDQLDKDVNLFAMRVREWYGYHFPELIKLVPDNYQYAQAAQFIGNKDALNEEKLSDLQELLDDDSTRAQNVLDAARGSMGSALSELDMINIGAFATRVVSLAEYRKSLAAYLVEKMNQVAPSLTALLSANRRSPSSRRGTPTTARTRA